jgi:hypothetical protein
MNKEIRSLNTKGMLHGYQELYYTKGKLSFRGKTKNGFGVGYIESHRFVQTLYKIR